LGLYGKAGQALGVPFERANKALTGLSMQGPLSKTLGKPARNALMWIWMDREARAASEGDKEKYKSEMNRMKVLVPELEEGPDWGALKGIPASVWKGVKAAIPYPGMGKDAPTYGETLGESFKNIAGREAPGWVKPVADIAFETAIATGVAKVAKAKLPKPAKPLTSSEIKQAQNLYTKSTLAKMDPVVVRAELDKVSKLGQAIQAGPSKAPLLPTATETQASVNKLIASVKRAKIIEKKASIEASKELSKRVGKAARRQEEIGGRAGFRAGMAQLKGPLKAKRFEPVEPMLAEGPYPFHVANLVREVETSGQPWFQRMRIWIGLEKVFRGDLPTRGEIALLERTFGKGLGKELLAKRPWGQKISQATLDALNLPRAIVAAYDMSGALRQGGFFLPGHPILWSKSFVRAAKAAIPGKKGKAYAQYFDDMAARSKYAPWRQRAGLYQARQWQTGAGLTAKEEAFMTTFHEKIPGLPWSERHYSVFLDQLRVNVFDDIASKWDAAGIKFGDDPARYRDLAKFINIGTGRGDLKLAKWANLNGAAGVLNAAFFSPRYQVAEAELMLLPVSMWNKAPAVRKIIAKDYLAFVGTGLAALYLAKQAGAEVEVDPRSTDFGKIKVGNTRWNYWGTKNTFARAMAQFVTSQRKSATTAKIVDTNRGQVVTRFLRTKLSPAMGFATDWALGGTMLGDAMDFEATPEAVPVKVYEAMAERFPPYKTYAMKEKRLEAEPYLAVAEQAWNRLTPLVIQDLVDGMAYQGLDGATPVIGATAFFGVGVQTYPPSKYHELAKMQDHLSLQTYGDKWDNIAPFEQMLLKAQNPGIRELKESAAYERNSYFFLAETLNTGMKMAKEVESSLPKDVRRLLREHKIALSPLARTTGDWRMNDDRFDQYKTLVGQKTEQQVRMLVRQRGWRRLPKTTQKKMLKAAVSRAQSIAGKQIKAQANLQGMQ
jgi:hypothetical protein